MQPSRHTRLTATLVVSAVFGCAAAAVMAAPGHRHGTFRATSPPTALPFTDNHETKPCSAKSCSVTINSTTEMTTFDVKAMAAPTASAPALPAGTRADPGRLNEDQRSNNSLSCNGYSPTDSNSVQFFLGATTLGNVFYVITDTVKDTNVKSAEFCLGAVYPFKTKSGKDAPADTLPNNLPGFVGLLPACAKTKRRRLARNAPCVLSRTQSGSDARLTVQVLAIGGDPWARS